MDNSLIKRFMQLAGQKIGTPLEDASPELRVLGAQLLLSETLEYVIKGLGVIPQVDGTPITDANALHYAASAKPDLEESIDGLADVAYTMFWNSTTFGLPLEEAFDLVAHNNLEKFVKLDTNDIPVGPVARDAWDLNQAIQWPPEVVSVDILKVDGDLYAVGKDRSGKVRKPSSYQPVDLGALVKRAANG